MKINYNFKFMKNCLEIVEADIKDMFTKVTFIMKRNE